VKDSQPARHVTLTARNLVILVFGLVVTAFLALGSHDLAIAHLGIPYPNDGDVPAWARCTFAVEQAGISIGGAPCSLLRSSDC
jgi:hypothetical protein